ncbi:MAG: PilZ domain-containing protein [Elusimicrobia bacterium]|nr:PilZ domain-containing protein [Elusimicrobiota bacterium]
MNLMRILDSARKRFSVPSADPSASKAAGTERRRSARATLDYRVELLDAARRPAHGAVHLLDLSGVGLGISASQDFRVGDSFGVTFKTPEGTVDAKAKVRWARPEGVMTAYGLELQNLSFWDRRRIDPTVLGPDGLITMALQFGALTVSVGVAADWMLSDPARLPVIMILIVAGFLGWVVSKI